MTPEQMMIEKWVSDRCGIDGDGIPGPIPIAAVRWEPGKLFYAELGCYDQHHLHVIPYDTLVAPHSVGVEMLNPAGELLAYLAPWPEWHDMTYDRVHLDRQFEARDRALVDPVAKRQFDQFFMDGIG